MIEHDSAKKKNGTLFWVQNENQISDWEKFFVFIDIPVCHSEDKRCP